jgi:hypothetical protein
MDGETKQRARIKLCVKFGKSAIETLELLYEASPECSLSQIAVFERHSCVS